MPDQLDALRTELIGMEAIIAEFQKWKLIGMGAVFSVGLGLSETSTEGVNFILALFAVPVITTYADLLIRDYDIRLSLIACYMRSQQGIFGDYERSLPKRPTRGVQWIFGHSATIVSSIAANGAVLFLTARLDDNGPHADIKSLLFWGATTGIVLCLLIQAGFLIVVRKLFQRSEPDLDDRKSAAGSDIKRDSMQARS